MIDNLTVSFQVTPNLATVLLGIYTLIASDDIEFDLGDKDCEAAVIYVLQQALDELPLENGLWPSMLQSLSNKVKNKSANSESP